MSDFYFNAPLPGKLARLFCILLAFAVSGACSDKETDSSRQHVPERSETSRPNIVLLLLDDAGYSDMSAFGGEIQTPNIERVAREGMTVSRFYNTSRCSPTRAGILSGRYPHDVGMADLAGPRYKTDFPAYQGYLPLDIPLVSELLQAAGYRTYLQGKWHLGGISDTESEPGSDSPPNVRGFDHFFGVVDGQAPPYPKNPLNHPYKHNHKAIKIEDGWFSIAGLNNAMMKQLKLQFQTEPKTPFFIFIASQSPHLPLEAPQALIDKYRKVYDRPLEDIWKNRVANMRHLGLFPAEAPTRMPQVKSTESALIRSTAAARAAMIEAADIELGKLLQLLEEYGKLDNTLIIVTSDNGAEAPTSRFTNAPFKGGKKTLYEGGTLAPLAARWPTGKITIGGMTDEMTTYLDLMPTFLQAAGVGYPTETHNRAPLSPLQGRNLLPLLRGERLSPPEYFYWNLEGHSAVIHNGQWKLVANDDAYGEHRDGHHVEPLLQLYDLSADPAETKDLLGTKQDMASSMMAKYQVWAQQHGAVPYYRVLEAYTQQRAARGYCDDDACMFRRAMQSNRKRDCQKSGIGCTAPR